MKKLIALLALLASQQLFVGASAQPGRENANGTLSLIAQTSAINAEVSELKTIIITGFGTDPDSATRNAAENALNEVVGSIISSEKLLEKRSIISNGIKEQTKSIQTNIVDYSQGSLKSVKVLEVRESNGLYTVTAIAVVRIEDFTRFIEKLAKDERTIGGGIFAGIQANRENSTTKFLQLKEVLSSVPAGKAQEIEVGEPFLAGKKFSPYIPREWSAQETIVVPVQIYLKPDYTHELNPENMAIEVKSQCSLKK